MIRLWFERTLFVLVLMLAAACACAAEQPTQQNKQAVIERVRPLAKQGNANAQYNLGVIYNRGYGVPRNYDKARKWYKKAASQGYAKAAHNLGVLYQKGHGVPVNHERAAYWFKKAAKLGEPAAQNNLAVMYARGQGVEQNMRKAALWAARAAQAGNRSAIANLPKIIEELPQAAIAGDNVNIRSKPTTNSDVLKQSASGARVVLLQRKNEWSRVLFPSDYVIGWVANFLLKNDGAVAAAADGASGQTGKTAAAGHADAPASAAGSPDDQPAHMIIAGDVVNIRKQPSRHAPVLFQATQGNRVTVLKDGQNGWKYVQLEDGRSGWVAGFLLE